MDLILVAVMFLGSQSIAALCCFLVLRAWYRREKAALRAEVEDLVQSFLAAPDKDTPSPFAVLLDQGALLLASRLVQQLKSMLAGTESGLSRAESAAEQLSMLDTAPPWVSALAGILPAKLRNRLVRNPQMVGALSNLLGGGGGSGNHGTGTSVRDRLK